MLCDRVLHHLYPSLLLEHYVGYQGGGQFLPASDPPDELFVFLTQANAELLVPESAELLLKETDELDQEIVESVVDVVHVLGAVLLLVPLAVLRELIPINEVLAIRMVPDTSALGFQAYHRVMRAVSGRA